MEDCFMVYESDSWPRNWDSDFTFNNCLFGVILTKNADPDKYSYSSCGIAFDKHI